MITRREFALVLSASAVLPTAVFAQQKVWRVGFLSQRHIVRNDSDDYYGPFTRGMRELGYVIDKDIVIEWRSADGKSERLPQLAMDLVRLKVDVLLSAGTPAAHAAQKATASIPIVMINVSDPLASGLVKSLARPGGNSTALATMTTELGPKLLEMLREMLPSVTRVAILFASSNANNTSGLQRIQAAAQSFGIGVLPVPVRLIEDIKDGFATMSRQKAGALIVMRDGFTAQYKSQIAELAFRQRLPSIGGHGEYVEAGGLISYGHNFSENPRRAAIYVDKILKGTNAGDLPVEQPTRFQMVVNLKTAKALGIKVPDSILLRADKVIE